MATLDISQIDDTVVIHFEAEGRRINAYTLASTLVAIADAAKAANTSLNAGCEVEVVVEAIGPGSFRAQIRAIYSQSKGLLSNQVVAGVIIGVIGNYIYERTLAVDDQVRVEIKTDEVIINRGNDRVIVPRNVYDATRTAEKNPQFTRAVSRAFEAVAADESVSGMGFVKTLDSPKPDILIPRSSIKAAAVDIQDLPDTRTVSEQVDLQILKAILDRSNRKWEFMWRGIKISAPVTDEKFYLDFFAHEITIAPGDILKVTLNIRQSRDQLTGIYSNVGYEVVEVHGHVPRIRQMNLADSAENG